MGISCDADIPDSDREKLGETSWDFEINSSRPSYVFREMVYLQPDLRYEFDGDRMEVPEETVESLNQRLPFTLERYYQMYPDSRIRVNVNDDWTEQELFDTARTFIRNCALRGYAVRSL